MQNITGITCKEAGLHLSKYFVYTKVPEGDGFIALDLFQGSFVVLTPTEMYLLSIVEELDVNHPALERFKKFGLVVDFDQRAALNAMGRVGCSHNNSMRITICPTMGCNFDCPYCFEDHRGGRMDEATQDAVCDLIRKMLDSFGINNLSIMWFGGEPLLTIDVIVSLTDRIRGYVKDRNGIYNAAITTNGYYLNQDNIDILHKCGITSAQVTLDGVGKAHDSTRHLAGGGPTYDTICKNLTDNKIPFEVNIRHNVHKGNYDQIEPLRTRVKQMAEVSGNNITYYSAPVHGNVVMDTKDNDVKLIDEEGAFNKVELHQEASRYTSKSGIYCSANRVCDITIDDKGRLYKCWEDVDKPNKSFGHVTSWNPYNPIRSAGNADMISSYLNACCPVDDDKCRDCLWLPMCSGGCPRVRIDNENGCFSFKEYPEEFALEVYKVLDAKEKRKGEAEANIIC